VGRRLTPLLLLLALAGCGGGGDKQASRGQPTQTAAVTTETQTQSESHSRALKPKPKPKNNELHTTVTYKCDGEKLRALEATGPVKVKPQFVKPGQSFTVTITDANARQATVSLTGVASNPLQAEATNRTAMLTVPANASCGNKLITVEGDVSAQAYVGVGR
jgi:exosome complex RNA-binding protein Csl4